MDSVSTYIHHHIAGAGEFPVGEFPVNWETDTKDAHRVVPDASSPLRRAWWSILKQEFNKRWDLGLPLSPTPKKSKAKSITLLVKSSSRQCSLRVKWWLVFSAMLLCFVDWFHTSRLKNNCCCCCRLSGNWRNSRRLFVKRDQDVDERSSFARQCCIS